MSFPRYPRYTDSGVEWLGEVPEHWTVSKLKHLALFSGGGTPSREVPAYWNGDIPWVSPKDMKAESIVGTEECITNQGLQNSASSLVPAGRVLLVVRSGILKHTIPVAINEVPVALNQDMKALHFHEDQSAAAFVLRWIQGHNDQLLLAWAKQGATVESIEQELLGNTIVALPDRDERAGIVAFLDYETAKIDLLIAEQQRLIELLKEKRQAVVSHAVTRGLDPDAPMKPTGVEWLGDAPAHWKVLALGRVTLSRCDGPFGSGLKSDHYTESGARVIRLQNLRRGYFSGADEAFVDTDYFRNELTGHDVVAGDLLIAGLGDDRNTVGRACVAPIGIAPALVKADCFRFRLDVSQVAAEFAAAQLTAGSEADAGLLSTGSTRSRIPLSIMATRKLALPPIAEQNAIVQFIQTQMLHFDALTAEAERAIALLQERRTALISAAVTGKIDVRGLAQAEAA